MRVVRAEWARLMRPGMLLGGAGLLVVLGVLGTLMVFGLAEHEPEAGGGGAPATAFGVLEAEDGVVRSMLFSSQIIGAVSMVIFARSIANDFAHGTLKVMLTREPRRFVWFLGKVVALTLFVTAAIAVAVVAIVPAAAVIASARGMDASAWWTAAGWAETAGGAARLWFSSVAWGLFGLLLGTLTRSAGLATGIGIGVFAIGEHMAEMFWADAGRVLPGLVLAAFAAGGTYALSLTAATALGVAYAVAFAGAAALVFARRDVAG